MAKDLVWNCTTPAIVRFSRIDSDPSAEASKSQACRTSKEAEKYA